MLQYIAFDYRSMRTLLDKKNSEYFTTKFPLFYKNEDGKSAIDVALDKNLIRSVNLFNDYICKYQNTYIFAHLFEHNLLDQIKSEVTMIGLFKSSIFNHDLDYAEWPGTHKNTQKIIAPYNGSSLKLRYRYPEIFRFLFEHDFHEQDELG